MVAARTIGALALLAVAGCPSSRKGEVVAEVRGVIVAGVVRVEKRLQNIGVVGVGHVGIQAPDNRKEIDCEVRIREPKALTLDIEHGICAEQRMVADDAGMRLAWGNTKLRYLYFGTQGRSFDGPKELDEPVDWGQVPTLLDALPAIFAQALEREAAARGGMGPGPPGDFGNAVIDEMLERRGPDLLVQVLLDTRASPIQPTWGQYVGLWHRALTRLDPARQGRVHAGLLEALRAPNPAPRVRHRALQELDLDADEHDEMLLARAAELVDGDVHSGANLALAVLFRRLARTKPRETAELACKFLGKPFDARRPTVATIMADDEGAAMLAVAVARLPCAAATRRLELAGSDLELGLCTYATWFCPSSDERRAVRHRCAEAEAAARLGEMVGVPWADLRHRLGTNEQLWLPAAVLLLQLSGPLPPPLERAVARQGYAWRPKASELDCGGDGPDVCCAPRVDRRRDVHVCRDAAAVRVDDQVVLHFDDGARQKWFAAPGPDDPGGDAGVADAGAAE
ncbi:MAG: hypothetical protein WKG00_00065 [Polyangiaceae bacterium]